MTRVEHPLPGANPTRALMRDIAEFDIWPQAAGLALAGYAVVPDVLSPAEASLLRSRVTELLGSSEAGEVVAHDELTDVLAADQTFLRLLSDERVNTLLAVVLGGGFLLSSIRVHSASAGAPAGQSPTDDPSALPSMNGQALYATSICCLNDWKTGRGAVQVVPGSHMASAQSAEELADTSSVECPAGSVIVTNGNLRRRFGPYDGRGSLPNVGLVAVHCRDFVAPRETYPDLIARVGIHGSSGVGHHVRGIPRSAPPWGP